MDSDKTRPTTDRVKESMFNIILPFIENANILDLFSGTGSLAIEALSRGAKSAVLVDKNPESVQIIRNNLKHTHFDNVSEVLNMDYSGAVKKLSEKDIKFDMIFLDPPYSKQLIDESLILLNQYQLVVEEGLIIAEKSIDDIVPDYVGTLKLVRKQKYGKTELCFYRNFSDINN